MEEMENRKLRELFENNLDLDEKTISKQLKERSFSESIIRSVRTQKEEKKISWWEIPIFSPRQIIGSALAFTFLIFGINFFILQNAVYLKNDNLVLTKKKEQAITINFQIALPRAQQVQLVGDFTNWQKGKLFLTRTNSKNWSIKLPLEKGRYQYQFLIDGKKWLTDPNCPKQIDDGFGRKNSLLIL